MTNNLSSYLKGIVENLKVNYSPEKIILFGSYSDGTFSEDSDIDLLIVKKTKKHPIWRRVEARKASCTKIPMDILVYTPAELQELQKEKSFFIMDIMEKGKVLYEN
ncbi:MAG: nucleotidyltransferase domain-containing protein [Candidatus Heimdallarchaeota archaeon]|nr:nucleotidyltransferase domain-containing protein [Candidatus Heimdallarchaeota archaeon]